MTGSRAWLRTDDGVRLAARWWRPHPVPGRDGRRAPGREAVVVVHGFCGSKDSPAVELVALHQAAAGRRVLTFDLRGHGGSDGATTMGLREWLDVDAAVRAARVDADVVVVVGASMGGVACIDHLSGWGPAALPPSSGPVDGVVAHETRRDPGRCPDGRARRREAAGERSCGRGGGPAGDRRCGDGTAVDGRGQGGSGGDSRAGSPSAVDGRGGSGTDGRAGSASAGDGGGGSGTDGRAGCGGGEDGRAGGGSGGDGRSGPALGGPGGPVRADGGVLVCTPAHWQVPRSARGVLALALTRTVPGRAVAARRMGTRVAPRAGRRPAPVEHMGAVTAPVAVLHGLADRFVSPDAARALYAAAGQARLLELIPGMGHGFSPAAVAPVGAAVDWVMAEVASRHGGGVGSGVEAAPR